MSLEGTPEAPTESAGATETQPDPMREQFDLMSQKLDSLSERFPEKQEEPAPQSLTERLYDESGQEGLTDEELAQLDGGEFDGYADDPNDPYAGLDPEQALAAYVQDQINEAVSPLQEQLSEREVQENISEVNALQDKYPDLKTDAAIQGQVVDQMEKLAKRFGEDVLLDAGAIELVYKAIKADAASAGEESAESAARREATLETGAGPSQQGETDPDVANYLAGLKKAGTPTSGAF